MSNEQLNMLNQLYKANLLSHEEYQAKLALLTANQGDTSSKNSKEVGAGSVSVGGNVGGSIITGNNNIINQLPSSQKSPYDPTPEKTPSLPEPAQLRDKLIRYFSKGELEQLCFDMDIDEESLKTSTKDEFAKSLITYCNSRNCITQLRARAKQLRPHVDWD